LATLSDDDLTGRDEPAGCGARSFHFVAPSLAGGGPGGVRRADGRGGGTSGEQVDDRAFQLMVERS
jgi:hypothetical protein